MQIIYSEDIDLIKLKLESLIKKYPLECVTKISLVEIKREKIGTILMTSFNNQKKLLILEDAFFLSIAKNKLENNFNDKEFWKLLSYADQHSDLVLTVVSNKILNNWPKNLYPIIHQIKPWSKMILKKHLIKNLTSPIEEDAVTYFLDAFHKSSIKQINNEINKINNLYPSISSLSLHEISEVIIKPLSFNIFAISSAFLEGDIDKFLNSWNQGFNEELNIQQLLAIISKQLIDLNWYLKYQRLGFSDLEIINYLNLNPYYLKKLLANNHQQLSEINDRIKDIYDLNKKIILGKIDKKIIPGYLFLKMFPHSSERKKNGTN